jgi:hypothetical protein
VVSTLPAKLTEGTLYYVLGSAVNKSKPPSPSRGQRKCRADWQLSREVLQAAYRRAAAKPPQERVIVFPYDLQPVAGGEAPVGLNSPLIGR